MELQWKSPAVVAAVAAASILVIWFLGVQKRVRRRLPPGPPAWPVLGHLHLLMRSHKMPHHIIHDLAKLYGPVMLLKFGSRNQLYISSPEIAQECFKSLDHIIAYRPETATMRYTSFRQKHIPFAPYGAYWRYARKILTVEMLNSKRMQQFAAVRAREIGSTCSHLLKCSRDKKVVNLQKSITEMIFNVISTMVLNKRYFGNPTSSEDGDANISKFHSLLRETLQLFPQMMVEDYIPALSWIDKLSGLRRRMQETHQQVDATLGKFIEDHRRHPKQPDELKDFVDVLLTVPREDGTGHFEDSYIRAILQDMFAAGTDSTAATIEWVMSELLANPEVMNKAQEEVDSVVGKERNVQESDTEKMPYLHAVVKETFRRHMTTAWLLPHMNTVDCKIGGYDIPANTVVRFQVWGMARDPSLWNNPAQFSPERFMGSDVDVKGQHMHLLPFGAGRRICPGMNFALNMVHTIIARMIHSFDWSLPKGMQPADLDMTEMFGLTLGKRIPLEAVPASRLSPHLYNDSG